MLARVRGEFPDRSAGDAGMVPLSSRETAKGGTQIPQTRFAQTVRYLRPNAVTRELRGTRSPDQGAPARILTAVGQARYVSVVCRERYGLAGVGRECRDLQQEYPVFSGFFVI